MFTALSFIYYYIAQELWSKKCNNNKKKANENSVKMSNQGAEANFMLRIIRKGIDYKTSIVMPL